MSESLIWRGAFSPAEPSRSRRGDRGGSKAIALAAKKLGIMLDAAHVARVGRRSGPIDKSDWKDWLVRSGDALGLRVSFVNRSIADAAAFAEAHGPLIAYAEQERCWKIVIGHRGPLVRLLVPGHERAVDFAAFAGSLGLDEPFATTRWAILEPKLPLDEMRSVPDSLLTPERRLFRLFAEETRDLRAVVIYAIAIGLLALAVPIAVQALVNSVVFTTMLQPIVVLTALAFAALASEGLMRVLQASIVESIQQRTFARAAVDIGQRLASLQLDSLGRAHPPELANRFFDVMTVQKAGAILLLDGVGLLLQMALGMVLLAFYHPWLLAFDVILSAVIAFIVFVVGRGAVETSIQESKAKYAMAAWLEEIATHPTAFRAYTARQHALERADELATRYVIHRRHHWKILIRQVAFAIALQVLGSAALLGVGGWLVIQRQLTLGQLVAAELIVSALLSGLAKLSKHLESYYDLVTAVDKLGQLVDLPMERTGVEAPVRNASESRALSLDFRATQIDSGMGRPLATVTASIPPGRRVCVRESGGAGVRNLLDVVFGLALPTGGSLLVNGVDLRDLDLERYRSDVAFVRDGEVFADTIEENVRVGRYDLTARQIREALVAVGLFDEFVSLPEGLSTHLATGGAPLSRCQARRLAIARAIVDRPSLLILDGSLDLLDEGARVPVVEAVFSADANWTLIVATHRDDVERRCDERLHFDTASSSWSRHQSVTALESSDES